MPTHVGMSQFDDLFPKRAKKTGLGPEAYVKYQQGNIHNWIVRLSDFEISGIRRSLCERVRDCGILFPGELFWWEIRSMPP